MSEKVEQATRLVEGAITLLEAADRTLEGTIFERLQHVRIDGLRNTLELMEANKEAA